MEKINDGGPAFPEAGYSGMSLRDYLIAHAPVEPQDWFEPVVTRPADAPNARKELNETQLEQYLSDLWDSEPENCDPIVLDFANRYEQWRTNYAEFQDCKHKQRYIQWPAAWADAMLAAREVK